MTSGTFFTRTSVLLDCLVECCWSISFRTHFNLQSCLHFQSSKIECSMWLHCWVVWWINSTFLSSQFTFIVIFFGLLLVNWQAVLQSSFTQYYSILSFNFTCSFFNLCKRCSCFYSLVNYTIIIRIWSCFINDNKNSEKSQICQSYQSCNMEDIRQVT